MKKIFFAIIIAFVLNFFWEISQSFLYAPHYKGFEQLISVHLWASASDVMIVSVILLASEIIFERFLKNENKKVGLFSVIFLGFLLAVAIEKYALTTGMWAYNSWMPVIPWLKVGLAPVIQMMLIPAVVWMFLKKKEER
ncbi:MAG: hypothetical protein WCF93_01295 [Candidatus Moraniibacteriota bacterium]